MVLVPSTAKKNCVIYFNARLWLKILSDSLSLTDDVLMSLVLLRWDELHPFRSAPPPKKCQDWLLHVRMPSLPGSQLFYFYGENIIIP